MSEDLKARLLAVDTEVNGSSPRNPDGPDAVKRLEEYARWTDDMGDAMAKEHMENEKLRAQLAAKDAEIQRLRADMRRIKNLTGDIGGEP